MLKTKKLIAASAAALTVFGAAALLPKGAAGLMRPAAADTAVDASFNISECSVTIPYASYTYRGRGIQPTVTVTDAEGSKLVQDADYTVTYSNNTNVGTASIIVKGKGNYSGFLTKNFTVKPLDLSSSYAKVTIPYASYTYTGKAITPEVRVKFKDGGLIASGEYSLSYSDNTGVGNAYITVKGTSKNVIGTYKKAFVVKPAKNAIQSLTTTPGAFKVTWKKATPGAVGYQVKYSTDKNFVKNVHSYTSTDLSDLSENFSKVPNEGETWYVKVRSFVTKDGKASSTRYGNYSAVKSVTVASKPYSEAKLKQIVENSSWYTMHDFNSDYWAYADFDGDGYKEGFAAFIDDGHLCTEIRYIDHNGKVYVANGNVNEFTIHEIDVVSYNGRVFAGCNYGSGAGIYTQVYGIENGKPFRADFPDRLSYLKSDSKGFYSTYWNMMDGMVTNIRLKYYPAYHLFDVMQ